jgi:glycosyltransferase involved in cell wall biosynthesis
MRIAVLGNAAAIHTRRWAEALRERGHEARVFSLEPAPEGFADVIRLPAWPLPRAVRYPLARGALARELTAYAPDVVDAHYVPNYGFLGALAGRRPLVVQCWGSDLLVSAARSPLHARRARFALERADAVIADARVLADAALAFGAPAERLHVVPWGADLARFPLARAAASPTLVSVRMLEPIYDVATLIHAMPKIVAAVPAARLEIAGDGPLRADLEGRARALGLGDAVRFVGRVPHAELGAFVGRAAVYVSTSLSDSTSISLLEAMAAGAVPVVSDLPGNREWIEDGAGGRIFPTGDAPALADAAIATLRDAAFRERARATNRAIVEERGDWRKNLARVEALYASLARERARCA